MVSLRVWADKITTVDFMVDWLKGKINGQRCNLDLFLFSVSFQYPSNQNAMKENRLEY